MSEIIQAAVGSRLFPTFVLQISIQGTFGVEIIKRIVPRTISSKTNLNAWLNINCSR